MVGVSIKWLEIRPPQQRPASSMVNQGHTLYSLGRRVERTLCFLYSHNTGSRETKKNLGRDTMLERGQGRSYVWRNACAKPRDLQSALRFAFLCCALLLYQGLHTLNAVST
jgi:hypothetical protein